MYRKISLLLPLLALGGCAGAFFDPNDDSGLEPPPFGSAIKKPHAGADAPSVYVETAKRPPSKPVAPQYEPLRPWA